MLENEKRQINFDKTEEFNKEIRPILDRLMISCCKLGIPAFFSACYKNTIDHSDYFHDFSGTESKGMNLAEDLFRSYVNVTNGFDTIPPSDVMTYDATDDFYLIPDDEDPYDEM